MTNEDDEPLLENVFKFPCKHQEDPSFSYFAFFPSSSFHFLPKMFFVRLSQLNLCTTAAALQIKRQGETIVRLPREPKTNPVNSRSIKIINPKINHGISEKMLPQRGCVCFSLVFLNFYKDRKNIVWMFYYLPFQRLRKPHQTSNQTLFW